MKTKKTAASKTKKETPAVRPAQKAANNAPKTAAAPKAAKAAKNAPAATPTAQAAAPAAKPESTPRTDSKKAKVLDLLKRPGGATLKEIMAATDWEAHSVRGFLSGNLKKKMGLTVESAKRESGERAYGIR